MPPPAPKTTSDAGRVPASASASSASMTSGSRVATSMGACSVIGVRSLIKLTQDRDPGEFVCWLSVLACCYAVGLPE